MLGKVDEPDPRHWQKLGLAASFPTWPGYPSETLAAYGSDANLIAFKKQQKNKSLTWILFWVTQLGDTVRWHRQHKAESIRILAKRILMLLVARWDAFHPHAG